MRARPIYLFLVHLIMEQRSYYRQGKMFFHERHPDEEKLHPHKRGWNICLEMLGKAKEVGDKNVFTHEFEGSFRIAWMSQSNPITFDIETPHDHFIGNFYYVKPAQIRNGEKRVGDDLDECNRVVQHLLAIQKYLKYLSE